ncbi:hypothetical protein CALCODRAFT_487686 [Calocera cornea HHB12733]|uniref:Uncharacterized protein n=1 Tax=Calocera cornea HHB12733 TaxID=1353952 RepID=A0A165CZP3_9BASI|nr:hypothetical protein CALCODRAFT_487686 [Calocera cornea HHB12733]
MLPSSLFPSTDFFQALEGLEEPQRSIEKARVLRWLTETRSAFPDAATLTQQTTSTQSSGYLPALPSSASEPAPISSVDTTFEIAAEASPAQPNIGDLHRRLKAVEAAVVHPPAKRRKRKTKIQAGAESSLLPAPSSTFGINPARLERHHLDETELSIKRFLQGQIRSQLYAAMQYKVGDRMPCHGYGSKPDDPNLLWPDFSQNINGPCNRLLQMRATMMVLEDAKNHPENIPEEYREKWLNSAVLLELARISWPHLKAVWNSQRLEASDGGADKRKKASAGRRGERRRTRAAQMRKALKDFCLERHLDPLIVTPELVHDEWVGEEWSCDEEDGTKSSKWRESLYATGKITADERDEDDALFAVLEIKRPEWMDLEVCVDLVSVYPW